MPRRHPESGMHHRPTKNETPTLVPDLNRGTNAGMDRVDINAHLDGTGKRQGTSQGLTKVIGRDRGNLETQEEKTHGNPMETPRENDKLTLEQPAQGIDERICKDSKLTELKLNPHRNKRHHRVSTERILPTEGGRSVKCLLALSKTF